MNNLAVNERLVQIVVGTILAFILFLMILIGIRKKIIARRRAHEGSSDSQDPESKTETSFFNLSVCGHACLPVCVCVRESVCISV